MIIKVKNPTGFAQILNETLRDRRLDLDTRGALGMILSYSEGFDTDAVSFRRLLGVGREKAQKITRQLKAAGYLEIVVLINENGRIIDKEWIFYGESQELDFTKINRSRVIRKNQETEKPSLGKNTKGQQNLPMDLSTGGENLPTENPSHFKDLNKDLNQKQDLEGTQEDETSSSNKHENENKADEEVFDFDSQDFKDFEEKILKGVAHNRKTGENLLEKVCRISK